MRLLTNRIQENIRIEVKIGVVTDRPFHEFHNLVPFQLVLKEQANKYSTFNFGANIMRLEVIPNRGAKANFEPSSVEADYGLVLAHAIPVQAPALIADGRGI